MAGLGPGLSRGRSAQGLQRRCRRGPAGDCLSGALHTKYRSRSSLVYKGDTDSSLKNAAISLSNCSLESEFTETGRENGIRSSDFQKSLKDWDCFDDEQASSCDSSGLEVEKGIICSETDAIQNTSVYTEPGFTLPTHLAANTQENRDQIINNGLLKKILRGTGAQACNRQGLIPPYISQIYDELFVIHQKLQRESSAQQEYALQLQKRERCLTEQEALLFKHEAALAKIRGVEEEVHTKLGVIKEQHEAEVKQLTEALREITKENRRLKVSFDSLKEMNDSLRKQLSDVTELNKKLEGQARKVQARLENLQRKHEFSMVRKSNDLCQVMKQSKPVKQEKVMATSKTATLPLNSQVYELLTCLMDWISDQHLSKIKTQEEREDIHKHMVTQSSKNPCTLEKCMKLLPIAAEQLQWMPYVNPKLHMPVIKFIYWSIRQLDTDIQRATMRSTMRRLGEDIFKGIVSKGKPDSSSEQSTESKSKSAAFFKSSCMPLRFLSALIVLKTVTQVDYLAQVFDSLRVDLKTDEGKALFLEYQCVPVVLSHLKVSSRGLLSSALDGLLEMTMESDLVSGTVVSTHCSTEFLDTRLETFSGNDLVISNMTSSRKFALWVLKNITSLKIMVMDNQVCVRMHSSHREVNEASEDKRIFSIASLESVFNGSLQPFLEACSNESFFRTCSVLLRSSKLDIPVLEKLCVILQKLSRIKSNKKMFELFALHQMLQELRRTVNPDHTFLCINLNSILLNLELLKSSSLASSLSTSH